MIDPISGAAQDRAQDMLGATIALAQGVSSRRTRDAEDVDIAWRLGPHLLELPLLASAMDGVVSPQTAIELGRLGGLAVLNLEGIWTRYEDADAELERIATYDKAQATRE